MRADQVVDIFGLRFLGRVQMSRGKEERRIPVGGIL